MSLPKRILICLDDSEASIAAFHFGVELSQKLGAEVGLLQVSLYSPGDIDAGILPQQAEEAARFQAKSHISDMKALYSDISFAEFEPIGNPAVEILRAIELWKAELLVLGHTQHGWFQRLFVSRLESRIVDKISIPFLVVPHEKL